METTNFGYSLKNFTNFTVIALPAGAINSKFWKFLFLSKFYLLLLGVWSDEIVIFKYAPAT